MVDRDRYLAEIADHLPNGFFYQLRAVGTAREFLFCSNGVERVFGLTPEDVRRDASLLYSRIDPQFAPRVAAAEAESLSSGTPFFVEAPIAGPQGRGWIQVSSSRRIRSDGLEVWEGLVLDVTSAKLAEIERAEAERRLELATAAAEIGIWHWDVRTGAFYYSARARAIYGFTPDETITYELLRRLTLPEDYAKIEPALAASLDPAIRQRQSYRYRITRADTGELRRLQAYGEASFVDWNGKVEATGYTGTLQDVTAEVRREQEIQEDRARLKLALEAGHLAVWELDVGTNTITPSPELNALYRFSADARPSLEEYRACYAPGERERVEAETKSSFERGDTSIDFEAEHCWPDGARKWIAVRAQIVLDEQGNPVRVLGVATDVTRRREYEERLVTTAQELQHRIKNTLAVVQTLAAQAIRSGKDSDEAIADLNGRLKALARSNDIAARPRSANAGVAELVAEIVEPFRAGSAAAQFMIDGPDVHLSEKDAVAVGMALHELCTNAMKYGALKTATGRVSIAWSMDSERFQLVWRETGGPPVTASTESGFGTRLLRRGLLVEPHGAIELEFEPHGVVCRIRIARD